MLKLLKYDWKRNSTIYYATVAVLLIVQASLYIGSRKGWLDVLVIGLSIMAFMAASLVLFLQACSTFNHHLKSFNRRLLPLKPLQEIAAVLLLNIIYTLTIMLIGAIVAAVMIPAMDNIDFSYIIDNWLKPAPVLSILGYSLWSSVNLLIWIMLAIAIARSFKVKHRFWIGLAAFIAIQSIIAYLSYLLFGPSGEAAFGFIQFRVTASAEGEAIAMMPTSWFNPLSGPFIMEIVTTVAALYAIVYLMNRKVEL